MLIVCCKANYKSLTGVSIAVGFIIGKDIYADMLRDGLVNSMHSDFTRGFAFWFFLFGVLLVLYGYTMQYYIRKDQKPAPLHTGYALLAVSIFGCLVEPVSGFWLVLPQALIIVVANRKTTRMAEP